MMKIRRAGIAGVALVAVLGLAACSSDSDSTADETTPAATESASPEATSASVGTIPEVAAEAGTFTTLVDAVVAAELADTLSTGEYTVFAPTDEAFAKDVDSETLTTLLEDPTGQLSEILKYHVVEGKVTAEDVVKLDGQDVATVNGETLKVKITNDGKVKLTDAKGGTVTVETPDVEASNGVIHVIDGVLMP